MEKNNKFSAVLITAIVLIFLFGGILFIFNKRGYLSFNRENNNVINNVEYTKDIDNNNGDVCLSEIVDYDTIQSANKFWYKLRGKWDNGVSSIEFKEINGYAAIVSGKHNYESSTGLIVSIEKVSVDSEHPTYEFNVVRPLVSSIDESDELYKVFQLYFDQYNAPYYTASYVIDISDLYRHIIRIGESEYELVNN